MATKDTLADKNRKYNAIRKQMQEEVFRDIDREDYIKNLFNKSEEIVRNEIDKLYMNYANQNGLSLSEVKKRADAMDVMKFQEKARKYVQNKDFSPEANEWLKVYNLKMKASRLELTKAEIDLELNKMYFDLDDYVYENINQEVLIHLQEQSGILGISSSSINERIEKITAMDFLGKNFSERIWGKNGHYHLAQKEIFKSLHSIFTTMDGYKQERRRLQRIFNVNQSQANTLLFTEITRAKSQTTDVLYRENGFTHYTYVSELNAGTCDICKELDGKVFKVEDREMGVNAAPMHPNCKCRDYAHIK